MNLISLDIRMLRSLISVVETGSITETARRLGRTQPAITLQLQRLEELTGKQLFEHAGRGLMLTDDGTTVLTYAKSILRLHDELISQLASQEIEGQVVLGTPDLYAAFMLPPILSVFPKILSAHPGRAQLRAVDAAGRPGQARRRRHRARHPHERFHRRPGGAARALVWMTGEQSAAHQERPIPLALLPPGNIYRDYADRYAGARQSALAHRLRQRSVGGLQAAAFAGMAVTVLGRSALVPAMREIGPNEGLPPLPKIELLLYKSSGATSKAATALHDYLAHYLRLDEELSGRGVPIELS